MLIARTEGRRLAAALGFSSADATIVATIVSELARYLLVHAGRGDIRLDVLATGRRCGVTITARDRSRGIGDIERALQGGFSTLERLGVGLAGVRRLADEFRLVSEVGNGTIVAVTKWK